MTLLISATRCVRCHGNAYYRDFDGAACLACGEPAERPAPLPLVLGDGSLGRTGKPVRREPHHRLKVAS